MLCVIYVLHKKAYPTLSSNKELSLFLSHWLFRSKICFRAVLSFPPPPQVRHKKLRFKNIVKNIDFFAAAACNTTPSAHAWCGHKSTLWSKMHGWNRQTYE